MPVDANWMVVPAAAVGYPLGRRPERVGGVASYFTRYASEELLPAASVHVTLVPAPAVSGPPYAVEPQESTPESASEPLAEIVTGARDHPAAFGARVAQPTSPAGACRT